MKTILEIKFTHRKFKSWVITLPFEVHGWIKAIKGEDLINIRDIIDAFFNTVSAELSRSTFRETWRVYLEES